MAKGPKRPKSKDLGRRRKKKVSILTQEGVEYVDWKDVNLLRRFMSDRAKIRARQVTGNNQQQQQEIARAIKNAREMALLPYNNRVTTQRGGTRSRDGNRIDGPAPRPTAPPPMPSAPMDEDEGLDIGEDFGVEDFGVEERGAEDFGAGEPGAEDFGAEDFGVEEVTHNEGSPA